VKLPFVSRAAFDAMHARAAAAELRAAWAARYDELLTKYHQLKLQGYTAPEPRSAVPLPPAIDMRSDISRAIDEIPASRDSRNRKAMLDQVDADRAAGVSDAEIVLRIRRGNRPAEELE
jgi:hypothetical protein